MPEVLLGRYRLMTELGRGGMGQVWRGHDELLDREVAIKVIADGIDRPENEPLIRRSLREARIAARLSHSNIADVYDVIEDDGRLWIVLQLVPAPSLGQLIAENGPLPPLRAARVGLDVLAALEAAHAAGVVHRDVKPGNILLPEGGGAVLTDFGIAAVANDDDPLTHPDVVPGTPAYIAPERAVGSAAGPASDLWSLGATLYTAVEGRPPFARDTAMDTLVAIVHDAPQPFERAGALAGAISALLHKDPDRRPDIARAREMLQALVSWDPPVRTAPTATTGYGQVRRRARHLAAAVLTLATCSAAVTLPELAERPRGPAPQAVAPPQRVQHDAVAGVVQRIPKKRPVAAAAGAEPPPTRADRPPAAGASGYDQKAEHPSKGNGGKGKGDKGRGDKGRGSKRHKG
ncbi:serine/threonine-protein kinase [Nonomuraea sp. KM90]|uniref:serine/threonine-protein kinase n=1 Tax=Nonomuraea sp. KM90 TaxID=3457428 RepID=UPI003FCE6D00